MCSGQSGKQERPCLFSHWAFEGSRQGLFLLGQTYDHISVVCGQVVEAKALPDLDWVVEKEDFPEEDKVET